MQTYTEPTFQCVTWIVRDFLELAQESGSFLDSPEFLFCGDRYCLRLYPKGKSTDKDLTKFHVRRLSVTFPEREVLCEVGIRSKEPNGDECYLYWSRSLEENVFYRRSMIEKNTDEFVPDGNLTVVCCLLLLSEESRSESSAEGEEERGGFPGHCASSSSRWSPTKMELKTEFPCTRVTLVVPDFFEVVGETGDSLTSPEFRFAGDTYCFRFQANGATADTYLELVRLTSFFTENTVFYRVGYGSVYPNSSRPLVGSRGFCLSRSKLEEERNKYGWSDGNSYMLLFLRLGERDESSTIARNPRLPWFKLWQPYHDCYILLCSIILAFGTTYVFTKFIC